MSGEVVSGLQPTRHGTERFLDFFFLELCAEESIANANRTARTTASVMPTRETQENLREEKLALADGSVRIFAERVGVTLRQNFHHPAVKIVHGVIHDWFEATVVFAMSFLNVVFQSNTKIFVFSAQANLFRS